MVFDPSVYERLAILETKLLVLQAELQAKQEELRAEQAAHMVQAHQGQVINYYFPIEVEVLGTLSEVEVQRFTRYVYDELLIAVQSQAPQVE